MISRALKHLKRVVFMRPIMLMKAWLLCKSSHSISCHEFNGIVYDYVDGSLPKNQSASFQHHINNCPICPNFLKAYISTHEARSQIYPHHDIDVPEAVPQDLIDSIRDVARNLKQQGV